MPIIIIMIIVLPFTGQHFSGSCPGDHMVLTLEPLVSVGAYEACIVTRLYRAAMVDHSEKGVSAMQK